MARGGARPGAGRPKGSLQTSKEMKVKLEGLGDTAGQYKKNKKKHVSHSKRGSRRNDGERTFVDDLAKTAAEPDDEEVILFDKLTGTDVEQAIEGTDVQQGIQGTFTTSFHPFLIPIASTNEASKNLLLCSKILESRSRWELAAVLEFFKTFKKELAVGTKRAVKVLGLRETHWAARPPSALELELALADPTGVTTFIGNDGTLNGNTSNPSRLHTRNAMILARTHLALLFGIEPDVHQSDKPPVGGWSKRWPEWCAFVLGDRKNEIFGKWEQNAPFDISAFEQVVEEDVIIDTSVKGDGSVEHDNGVEGEGEESREESKPVVPLKTKRVVRRSAAQAYTLITPTRRIRALWGLCEVRLSMDDVRVKAESISQSNHLGADGSGNEYVYVGGDLVDETSNDKDSTSNFAVVGAVARVCRAAPPRWDVYADALDDDGVSNRTDAERVEHESSPNRDQSPTDRAASPELQITASPVPGTPNTPTRGTLQYAERSIWADSADADKDVADRWAFIVDDVDDDCSNDDSSDSDSDFDSPVKKRKGKKKDGKKTRTYVRKETIEQRFARRERCALSDVIVSLGSEGKWAQVHKKAKPGDAKTGTSTQRMTGGTSSGEILSLRAWRVPPYHRFAKSFMGGGGGGMERVHIDVDKDVDTDTIPQSNPTDQLPIHDPGVPLDDIPCAWCGDAADEGLFVLCDGCPNGGHLNCLGLRQVPKKSWWCAVCADGGENDHSKKSTTLPREKIIRRRREKETGEFQKRKLLKAPREGAWETVVAEDSFFPRPKQTMATLSLSLGSTQLDLIAHKVETTNRVFSQATELWRLETEASARARRERRFEIDARARKGSDDEFSDDKSMDGSDSYSGDVKRRRRQRVGTDADTTDDEGGDALGSPRDAPTPLPRIDPSRKRKNCETEYALESDHVPCALCGEGCDACALVRCVTCPTEGHEECFFHRNEVDDDDDEQDYEKLSTKKTKKRQTCFICQRRQTSELGLAQVQPHIRASPSPVNVKRFPRRVPTKVRNALESDDDEAWFFGV